MNSLQQIIRAFGGMPALRKYETMTVRKDNWKLNITYLEEGIEMEESVCLVLSSDEFGPEREMHFETNGREWVPYFLRLHLQNINLYVYHLDDNLDLQTDFFMQDCLSEHARYWDGLLLSEGFVDAALNQMELPLVVAGGES